MRSPTRQSTVIWRSARTPPRCLSRCVLTLTLCNLHHETSSLVLAMALCIGFSLVAMPAGCADAFAPHNVRLIGTLTMCLHSVPSRSGLTDGHTMPHSALDCMLEPDLRACMTVQWTTRDSTKPVAMWGTSANSLTNTVNATSKTYTAVGHKLVSCTVR